MDRTPKDLQTHIRALESRERKRTQELQSMQAQGVKYQLQQGTKEDIYRLRREIQELRAELTKKR